MAVVYRPKHQRQITPADRYGGVNCTACSAAMAIDRATLGAVYVTGGTIRARSNEPIPDPKSPGLNLPQVVNVAFKLQSKAEPKGADEWLENRAGAPWSALMRALREFRGVVLQGDYDQLPPAFSCQKSMKGDHAVYVNHVSGDGDLYVMDPLCKSAREVPEAVMRAYAEKFARTVGRYPGVLFATTRTTSLV
jgi:hypothetical protein